VTLVFTVAMAAVLATAGLVLHNRVSAALTEQVDERLRVRAELMRSALAREPAAGAVLRDAAGDEDAFVQVVGAGGRPVAVSGGVGAVLGVAASADGGPRFLERTVREADGDDDPARILVVGARSSDGPVSLLVGESLTDRRDALDDLTRQLAILGPAALAVAALLGYLVAAGALRPVDAMRRRAEEIGPSTSGARLPLPPATDEVRRLGETLNAMLARLDEGIARERRFAADAGHELRTPLAVLRAELELVERRPRTAGELTDALRSAREEVERLSALAEDLLALAAVDSGGAPMRLEDIPVIEVLEAVARRSAGRTRRAGREVVVVAPPGVRVVADRGRLERAVENLVDNALRHGAGEVVVRAAARGAGVTVSVADRGPGIAPALLASAFDPFTSGDRDGARPGSGLGLAIVRAVADAHGGSVHIGSSPGGGAIVSIDLPGEMPR
jgi:signal transduction histidine kinase